MLARLSALLTSKVALAAIGCTLIAVGGATAAAAATGHIPANIPVLGFVNSQHGNKDGDDHGHQGTPTSSHTVAIQGTLSAYDATQHTITVQGKAEQGDDSGDDSGD